MDLSTIQLSLDIIAGTLTILGGLLAALWAYTRFILERGLLPPSQFSIDCNVVGQHQGKTVLEILLLLENVGSSTLIAKNIRVDVRCLDNSDEPKLFDDPKRDTFGRLRFPHSLKTMLIESRHSSALSSPQVSTAESITPEDSKETRDYRGMLLLRYHTFIQAGVEQVYTFTTAVPESIVFVLVWASFEYELRPSPFQRKVLRLARGMGLLQYNLDHVSKPHTAERVFRVSLSETDNIDKATAK